LAQLVVIAGSGSGVGKTLLGERLVEALAARGVRVAVVKHVHHGVDYRVKDTGRYVAAGARRVLAVGPDSYMLVERGRLGFWDAVAVAAEGGAEVVVVEGFREMLWEALAVGGCGVYIGPPGDVEGLRAEERLVVAEPGRALEALDEALAMLLEGRCMVERVP
jgi:molybdopterin-guanine dinucleotide biosynthesis protein B